MRVQREVFLPTEMNCRRLFSAMQRVNYKYKLRLHHICENVIVKCRLDAKFLSAENQSREVEESFPRKSNSPTERALNRIVSEFPACGFRKLQIKQHYLPGARGFITFLKSTGSCEFFKPYRLEKHAQQSHPEYMRHLHHLPFLSTHARNHIQTWNTELLILIRAGTGGHWRGFTGSCWFMVTNSSARKWLADSVKGSEVYQWCSDGILLKPQDSLQRLRGIISALL